MQILDRYVAFDGLRIGVKIYKKEFAIADLPMTVGVLISDFLTMAHSADCISPLSS
jgi:hypothetical protein